MRVAEPDIVDRWRAHGKQPSASQVTRQNQSLHKDFWTFYHGKAQIALVEVLHTINFRSFSFTWNRFSDSSLWQ